jgi:hypothetical protein
MFNSDFIRKRSGTSLTVLFFTFILVMFINHLSKRELNQDETNILMQQFHLSEGKKIETGRYKRRDLAWRANPLTIDGYVDFSEEEFRAYQASLNNTDFWKSQPIEYDGHVFTGSYAPNALNWVEKQSGFTFDWGRVSYNQVQYVKNAKVFCFVMPYPGTDGAAIAPYDAAPCSERTHELDANIIVQGLLDEDNRTLHMLVRGRRPNR